MTALQEAGEPMSDEWQYGDALTPREQLMIASAARGEPSGATDASDDSTQWGDDRVVRAAVLRHLLVEDDWPVHAKGVRLVGTRITGELDVTFSRARCLVAAIECTFDEPLRLAHAQLGRVVAARCRLGGIQGDGLDAPGGLVFHDCSFSGEVRFNDATVSGVVDFSGSYFTVATDAEYSLAADRARVRGSVLLRALRSNRPIRLLGCDFSGSVDLSHCELKIESHESAVVADGLRLGGDLHLSKANITSATRLPGVHVGGQVTLNGARLGGEDRSSLALEAPSLVVNEDLFMNDGFIANGGILLRDARIGGSLFLHESELNGALAFLASGAHIAHALSWAPRKPVAGAVILDKTQVGLLEEDWGVAGAHWPGDGRLSISGFKCGGFGGHVATVRERLGWIRSQYDGPNGRDFSAQPYEQLISVYRELGQDTDAREVAVAKQDDLRRYGELTLLRRLGNRTLGITIRHGYAPLRAVVFLAVVYVAVLTALWHGQHRPGTIVPARSVPSALPYNPAENCASAYPCFYPALYALDVVVPVLDVRDADAWRPNGDVGWGWVYVVTVVLGNILGWAFSTLAVLGYTRVVRRE